MIVSSLASYVLEHCTILGVEFALALHCATVPALNGTKVLGVS